MYNMDTMYLFIFICINSYRNKNIRTNGFGYFLLLYIGYKILTSFFYLVRGSKPTEITAIDLCEDSI